MQITMIGAGYVGLVSGACLADFGHDVTCIDVDAQKVARLRAGDIPIYEPGLADLVVRNAREGRLMFSADASEAVPEADVVFLAVGTPRSELDGGADLSQVHAAAEAVARAMNDFTVVVTKSTVPVGTGDEVDAIIRATRPDADFAVVSNPEFLREGAAINDFKLPNRIVVGTEDARAREVMSDVYRPLFINQSPLMFTDRRTAELIKYASNAYLATKVTYINEMADLCEAVGANVQDLARGMGLDNRIGSKFLHPGPGYGGSCFPKDTVALLQTARSSGVDVSLVDAVVRSNDRRKRSMASRIANAMGGSIAGKTIAVLGLTFKPNTDDMREAPVLEIIPRLQAEGARIRAFDPVGMSAAKRLLSEVEFADDAYDCALGADALVFATEWNAFRALDLDRMRETMNRPLVVDLRNIYPPDEMRQAGFEYHSIGRPASAANGDGADVVEFPRRAQ